MAGGGRPADRGLWYADRVDLARGEGAIGRQADTLAAAGGDHGEGRRWAQALVFGSQPVDLPHTTAKSYVTCDLLVTITTTSNKQT